MKRAAALCLLGLMVSTVHAGFVINDGFESMSGDPLSPVGWSFYTSKLANRANYAEFAAETDIVYDGTYSEKILSRDGYGMIHQTIGGFSGGQTLAFWLYGRGVNDPAWQMDEAGDVVEVLIKFKNSGNGTISEISAVLFDTDALTDAPVLSGTDWLQSAVFSFVTPENTAQVQIKIQSVDGSDDGMGVYLDNVTLVPEPATLALLGLGGLLGLCRRKR